MTFSSPAVRRSRSLLVTLAAGAMLCLGALGQAPASAAPLPAPAAAPLAVAPPAAPPAAAPGAARVAGAVPVSRLAVTGTATHVTVRRILRTGQLSWVNHVVETQLVGLDGCQARRTPASWRGHVYRSVVYAVCPAGPAGPEAAARALVQSRPWYRISVDRVPLVGFTLLADVPTGNDRAVPAALATLPTGPEVFFEGDDVSLSYAGPGVTQARLDAAVAAFARALGLPTSRVSVSPLGG